MIQILSVVQNYTPDRRAIKHRWAQIRRLSLEFLSNPLSLVGSVIIFGFILMAILAPELAPAQGNDPYQLTRDWGAKWVPPLTDGHLLGTTRNGGDVFYGIVWGARLTLALSFGVVTAITVLGIVLGGLAGFSGGLVDDVIMRTVDALIAVPATIWAIAIVVALGPSYFNIGIALAGMLWGTYARLIRGEVISVKNSEYVDAAKVSGVGKIRIFFREILPNTIQPMFIQASLDMGTVVLIAAGLSFIGLAEPGLAEWGRITAMGQRGLLVGAWWVSLIPGLTLFLWSFAWNMVGDGLRDVLDPQTSSRE